MNELCVCFRLFKAWNGFCVKTISHMWFFLIIYIEFSLQGTDWESYSPRTCTVATEIRSINAISLQSSFSSVLLGLNGARGCRERHTYAVKLKFINRWLLFCLGQPLLSDTKGSWKDWVIYCMIVFITVSIQVDIHCSIGVCLIL